MIMDGLDDYRRRPSVCAHTRKTRKTRYDKKGAQSAINKRAGEKNQPATLRAYECKHCHGWHLTHKPKTD